MHCASPPWPQQTQSVHHDNCAAPVSAAMAPQSEARPAKVSTAKAAIVVIGGLVTSTALTLLLLPILFKRFGAEAGQVLKEQGVPEWKRSFAS